jgi:hypothetical protein
MRQIRGRLFELHPAVPPHSRLYFSRMPAHIGFLAGDGPAVRVWYRDPTLRARYYSQYEPRSRADSLGEDYFFIFDGTRVLREIQLGEEPQAPFPSRRRLWLDDHLSLAFLLLRKGDPGRAAGEFAKLAAAYPAMPDYALFAGAAFHASGAEEQALPYLHAAARALGDSAVVAAKERLVREARARVDAQE